MDALPGVLAVPASLSLKTISLLLVSAAYFLVSSHLGLSHYDEGLMAAGAWRVANGEVPYRDFWAIYPPGQYYALALLYQLFGPSVLAGRFYGVVVRVLTVALGSHLSGLFGGRKAFLQTWLLLTIWLGPSDLHLYPVGPAVALGLLSCLLAARSFTNPQPRRLILAGAAAGAVCLFRYDYGFYTFLAGSVVVCAGLGGSVRAALRQWLFYGLGLTITVLPPAVSLLAVVGPDILYSQFVEFPLHTYARFRSLPYPMPFPGPQEIAAMAGSFTGLTGVLAILLLALRKVLFYFPIVVLLAGLTELFLAMRRHPAWPAARAEAPGVPRLRLLTFVLILSVGSLNTVRVRPDLEHLEAPVTIALILAPLLLASVGRRIRSLGLLLAVAAASVVVQGVLARVIKESSRIGNGPARFSQLPRARGMWLSAKLDRDLEDVAVFLQATVPPDAPVFAGNTRHDRILFNDALFYFLVERPPATRYHELHPGIATTEPVQQEIVQELETRRVRHVVLFDSGGSAEPNDSSRAPGSRLLDQFIRERFRPVRHFGSYSVWEIRASPVSSTLTPPQPDRTGPWKFAPDHRE